MYAGTQVFTNDLEAAQRLALAAWWENQPTKRKKAFAWTPQFCTAHHQVRLHALLGGVFTQFASFLVASAEAKLDLVAIVAMSHPKDTAAC